MINAKDAQIWFHDDTKEVEVRPYGEVASPVHEGWNDVGASAAEWLSMSDDQRVHLMLEIAIYLAMNGYAMKDVLIAFSEIIEFRALGDKKSGHLRDALNAAGVINEQRG